VAANPLSTIILQLVLCHALDAIHVVVSIDLTPSDSLELLVKPFFSLRRRVIYSRLIMGTLRRHRGKEIEF
jgi:hypothetical protein